MRVTPLGDNPGYRFAHPGYATELPLRSAADINPLTRTRCTQAAPTAAARRVVRRGTPATPTGVKGRPTLASARPNDNESPSVGVQLIEPDSPGPTTSAVRSIFPGLRCATV